MEHPGASQAVFHLRNRTLILVVSPPISVFRVTRILAGLRSGEPWLNWLAGLVLWLFLLLLALRRRLLFTQQGLDCTESLTTVHLPWERITRLKSRRTLGIWPVEGLEGWTEAAKHRDIFIDLTQFSRSWREDSLGAMLRGKEPICSMTRQSHEALSNYSLETSPLRFAPAPLRVHPGCAPKGVARCPLGAPEGRRGRRGVEGEAPPFGPWIFNRPGHPSGLALARY